MTQGYAKEAHGSEQGAVDPEEGAAKVARGLAALERDMLNKITKPLGALLVALSRVRVHAAGCAALRLTCLQPGLVDKDGMRMLRAGPA